MSGIPVYTQSSTAASKANAPNPQTTGPTSIATPSAPASIPASTTTVPSATSPYAPQPGQGAVPAPTSSQAHPTGPAHNYTSSPTTPTQTSAQSPPAPQPGAVPATPGRTRSPLPPPPKAGEKYIPPVAAPQTTSPQYPVQMGYAPPVNPYQPTMTTTTRTGNYPTSLPVQGLGPGGGEIERKSLEHPPGYQQNPYVGNMSSYQGGAQPMQSGQWHRAGAVDSTEDESIWETAKKWAYSAGEKMAETEAEIWKRVNGEK